MNAAAKISIVALATITTFIFGCVTMYWSMTDRLEKQVTERVSQRVKAETKLTRLDERVKQLEGTVWTLQTSNK